MQDDNRIFPERGYADTFCPFNMDEPSSMWKISGSTEFIPYIEDSSWIEVLDEGVVKFRIIDIHAKNVSDNLQRTFNESFQIEAFRPFGFDNVHHRLSSKRPHAFEERAAGPAKANCDIRLAFRCGNMFIVKKFFTFGLRKTKDDEVHVIQTSGARILYFCPRDDRTASELRRHIPGKFCGDLRYATERHVLQPWSTYEVPRNTPYLIITYQKTVFSLDVFSLGDADWRSLVIGNSPKNPNLEIDSIEEKLPPMFPSPRVWTKRPRAEINSAEPTSLVGPNHCRNKSQRDSTLSNIPSGSNVGVDRWNDSPSQNLVPSQNFNHSRNESQRDHCQMFLPKITSSNVPSASNTSADHRKDPPSRVVPSQNLYRCQNESQIDSSLANVPSGSNPGVHHQNEYQQDSANSTETIFSFSATAIKTERCPTFPAERVSTKAVQPWNSSRRDSTSSVIDANTTKIGFKKEFKLDPKLSVIVSERSHGAMQFVSCSNESWHDSKSPKKSTNINQSVHYRNDTPQQDSPSTSLERSSTNESVRRNNVSRDVSASTTNRFGRSFTDESGRHNNVSRDLPPSTTNHFGRSSTDESVRRNNVLQDLSPSTTNHSGRSTNDNQLVPDQFHFYSEAYLQNLSDRNSRGRPT